MQERIEMHTPTLSLNLKTTPTSSELYFEANWLKQNGTCPYYYWSEDNQIGNLSNVTDQSGNLQERIGTNLRYKNESDSLTVSPTPHLSSMLGLKGEFTNYEDNELCQKYKIFETKVENNSDSKRIVTHVFKDIFHYFKEDPYANPLFDNRIKKGRDVDQIFEENLLLIEDGSYDV